MPPPLQSMNVTTFVNNLGRTSVASNKSGNDDGSTRRQVLECMTWAGTGILWTVSGGVPKSLSLLGSAEAATAAAQSFTFAQISDSHIGFHVKPVNPDALATTDRDDDESRSYG
jgi:hypothetical protein